MTVLSRSKKAPSTRARLPQTDSCAAPHAVLSCFLRRFPFGLQCARRAVFTQRRVARVNRRRPVLTACWSVKGGSGTTVVAASLVLAALAADRPAVAVDFAGDLPLTLGMPETMG